MTANIIRQPHSTSGGLIGQRKGIAAKCAAGVGLGLASALPEHLVAASLQSGRPDPACKLSPRD